MCYTQNRFKALLSACVLLCALLERFYRGCACFFQVRVEDREQGRV